MERINLQLWISLHVWRPSKHNNAEDAVTTEVFLEPVHANVKTRDIDSDSEFRYGLTEEQDRDAFDFTDAILTPFH